MMEQDRISKELVNAINWVNEDPKKAQLLAEKAILRSQRNGWVYSLALANLVLGWSNSAQGINDLAVEAFHRSNTLMDDLQNAHYLAYGSYGLGIVYTKMGEYALAIEQYRRALSWFSQSDATPQLHLSIRLHLSRTLMSIGMWSDAEQELMSIDDVQELTDENLLTYQLLITRLAFFRGDERTVRAQLRLCHDLRTGAGSTDDQSMLIDYFAFRYIAKYENAKTGEKSLAQWWVTLNKAQVDVYFLVFEIALDLLESDYPEKGVHWLTALLAVDLAPLLLKHQVHLSLARFFAANQSHHIATKHFLSAHSISQEIRESEINQQRARFIAEDLHQSLKSQVARHKKNNQLLAESNSLLQTVNRVALGIIAAQDIESLIKKIRVQLRGVIDAEVIGIAEIDKEHLVFDYFFDGERQLSSERISLNETRSWAARAVESSRMLIENNFKLTDEIVASDSSSTVRSVAYIPLNSENKVIGVLTLQSKSKNVFDERAVSLLETMAPLISVAFANLNNLQRTVELSGRLNQQQKELSDARQLMAHLNDHDELTGLPNRSSLPEHFKGWAKKDSFHCILLRITNLDQVNTTAGFGTDEEMLKAIGQRVANRVRPDDLLARVGNDQFLLFIEMSEMKSLILDFAEQIAQLAKQPLRAREKLIASEVALGAVKYPEHGETLEELMSMASMAMRHAAEDGSGIYCIE